MALAYSALLDGFRCNFYNHLEIFFSKIYIAGSADVRFRARPGDYLLDDGRRSERHHSDQQYARYVTQPGAHRHLHHRLYDLQVPNAGKNVLK